MASATEHKKDVADAREIIARSRPIYRSAEALGARLRAFADEFKTFEVGLTMLCNYQESFERRMKDSEAKLAAVEREVRTRLQNIEHGSRTLTDELTRRQLAADAKMAEAEKAQRKADEARHDHETLKARYEELIAALPAGKK